MSDTPSDSFSSLALSAELLDNLKQLGYQKMTPIQAQSITHVLAGRDLIAQAKTGSGKTAAFGLGILEQINPRFFATQALILCPTRELADQVGKELRKLARCIPNLKLVLLCGGKPMGAQIGSLEHGAHIIVGTPGRIQDHLNKGTLKLDQLKTLVLDEADKMLDMGFFDAITQIITHTPTQRQTLLFSATFPNDIEKMSSSIQHKPMRVSIDDVTQTSHIEQYFYLTQDTQRDDMLCALFEHYQLQTAAVFCHTKKACAEVANFLCAQNIQALAIHGDLEQRERDEVLLQFSNNSCSVLVATDVAARGLDIKSLQAVINYELPRDTDAYIHRIGRTGRAGQPGMALSLYTDREQHRLAAIEAHFGEKFKLLNTHSLKRHTKFKLRAPMSTIQITAGRKNKIRPSDILGALTGDADIASAQIGKIDIVDLSSYIALEHAVVHNALGFFQHGKIKGRHVRARILSNKI